MLVHQLGGWQVECSVAGDVDGPFAYTGLGCGVTQTYLDTRRVENYGGPFATYLAAQKLTRYHIVYLDAHNEIVPGSFRAKQSSHYTMDVPDGQSPVWEPYPGYVNLPEIWQPVPGVSPDPRIDPDVLPIGQPAPTPKPLPYRALPGRGPNPYRHYQPLRGPYPVRVERPEGWVFDPYGKWRFDPKFRPRSRVKGRRHKEVKVRHHSAAYQKVAKILGNISEVGDFVDALHDAIPNKYWEGWKEHDYSLLDKMQRIWQYRDEINYSEAMTNILEQNAGDHWMGKAGSGVKDHIGNSGYPGFVGPGTGPAM